MDFQRWFYRNLVYVPVSRFQAGPVLEYLKGMQSSERVPEQERRESQLAAARALVTHAKHNVPYYEKALQGIDPDGLRTIEDLGRLPMLTKGDLQGSQAELRSRLDLGRLVAKTTGGSTGEPVTVLKERDAWARELAATWRGYGWAGVQIGERQARFWGVPYQQGQRLRARLIDTVCNRLRMSAFSFSEQDLASYVDLIERRKPRYLYGYVSMLHEFAMYLRRSGHQLAIPLKCVITTSEVLAQPVREVLAETFAAPVFDEYGCGELGTIAHECSEGSFHISEENMLVEVIADGKACAPGVPGELVVTELNNRAMPLIRYRTGDFGTLSPGPCSCGMTLRKLQNVHGRAYDFVAGEDGRRFHGEFILYIFEEIRRSGAGIRQFQCIQNSPAGFLVRIVREDGYGPELEALIVRRLREHVHSTAAVEFEYVDRIPRERSGKMRLIVGMAGAPEGGGVR